MQSLAASNGPSQSKNNLSSPFLGTMLSNSNNNNNMASSNSNNNINIFSQIIKKNNLGNYQERKSSENIPK